MISGVESQFYILERLPNRFELTGSRLFGNARTDSDWDFFAQNTSELQMALAKAGFMVDDASGYNTATIVMARGNIHVQLVPDFEHKLRAQEHILSNQDLRDILVYGIQHKTYKMKLWAYVMGITR